MGFNTEKGGETRYCVADWMTVHPKDGDGMYSDKSMLDNDSGMMLQQHCSAAMKLAAAGLAFASAMISFN